MLAIDLDARTLAASVRDLIEEPLTVPRASGALARVRAQLGTDVHRVWRREREAGDRPYEAEVHLTWEGEVAGFHVSLRGRADGILDEGERLVVEEVKSVEDAGDVLAGALPHPWPDAVRQARLYAFCLAAARPEAIVGTRLVLVSLVDGTRRILDVDFDVGIASRLLERLVRARVGEAKAARLRALRRGRIAKTIAFPYEEMRGHQAAFVDHVADGLAAGRPVLAMAPTGTGKTVGALLPALVFALERDAILFFLTAKTTQQALVARTFEDLVDASGAEARSLRALVFREKRRMCPPGTLHCHPDHCAYLQGFLQRETREAVLEELLEEGPVIEPEAIVAAGEARTVCPYACALSLTLKADLVIGDVNYVYDQAVAFSIFTEDRTRREAVAVIDEAHNLFDRAREYHSPFVARRAVQAVDRAAFREGAPWLAHLLVTLDRIAQSAPVEGERTLQGCRRVARPVPAWGPLAEEAARLMVRYAHQLQAQGIFRADDDWMALFSSVLAVADLLEADERELVPYVAATDEAPGALGWGGRGFGILCVNPAKRLAARHARLAGVVAMSATLHPLDYYADVLGLSDLAPSRFALPSPFPAEHRGVWIVPDVATTWRERARHYEGIARHVEAVVAARPGNYVAYFPSFRFLEDVRARLRLPAEGLLVQERGLGVDRRAALLQRLSDPSTPTLLLAVTGGVFAEGIDLPGEALVGAIVVGPALPLVGFERAAMQRYFDETAERGFAYAMLFPGLQRVIQAAGRVHRTPDDVGVIVLLGRRFAIAPYADALPEDWGESATLVTTDLPGALRSFWEATPGPGAACAPGGSPSRARSP